MITIKRYLKRSTKTRETRIRLFGKTIWRTSKPYAKSDYYDALIKEKKQNA